MLRRFGRRCSLLQLSSIIGLVCSGLILFVTPQSLIVNTILLLGIGIAGAGQIVTFAIIKDINESQNLATAIGSLPGDNDISNLRYGKICILADADSDGLHIATLLCALFLRHYKNLVTSGKIFVSMPPLYRIDAAKEVFYALDENEKESLVEKIKKQNTKIKIDIQRFKGLGEMNPSQLRETVMMPESRRLVQLTLNSSDNANSVFDLLLSKKRAPDRKEWLEKKGNLAEI